MNRIPPFLLLAMAIGVAFAPPAFGQSQRPADQQSLEPLRVFLDCDGRTCDSDHFRREVAFISYVRDRMDAELHVLVTSQATGAGGEEYSFFFIGLRGREGAQDTLQYVSRPDETDDETRSGLVQTFKLGLVRYVASTPVGRQLGITFGGRGEEVVAGPLDDPWDLWVFRISVSGELEGESQEEDKSFDGSISASRTTEDLKLDFSANGDWNERSVELSDGETRYTTRDYEVEGTAVWSLTSHWSAGASASASGSTRQNQDLALRAGPAVEYTIYPYAESTERQITFLYKVEIASFNYEEVTLFGKTSEIRPLHSLEIASAFEQPWGELDFSLEGSNFLDDFSQHNIEFFSRAEVRLFRGLSLDVSGSVSRIKDQIFLSGEGVSDEDRLLERRELGTDYEYSVEVGFSYTFGSVFNNIVNPRMSTGGRGRGGGH
jgi:hypothetical protein